MTTHKENKRNFERFKRRWKNIKGDRHILFEHLAVDDALAREPGVVDGVRDSFRAAIETAKGEREPPMNCFVCNEPWTRERFPVTVALVTLLDGGKDPMGVLGLVCLACSTGDNTAKIRDALTRDFGPFSRLEIVSREGGSA